jgi:hypothetical protein
MPDQYWLSHGSHPTAADGRCALEWVAHLAGLPHTDKPVCVSPMLQQFCIRLNDALPDDQRQRMRPYLARTLGTAGDGMDDRRNWMCANWFIRVYTPAWLDLVPSLQADAETLRSLPVIASSENVARAMEDLNRSRQRAAAAGAAAGDAAWDAAWAAAWAAGWAAAGAAGWAAARAAAGDAARAASWAAGWAAAGAAAWDAARAAAWDAARAAAGAAAGAAARDVLKPVTAQLQDSVLSPGGLLDRMLPTEVVQIPVVSEWRETVGVA